MVAVGVRRSGSDGDEGVAAQVRRAAAIMRCGMRMC
jgi:hypothetical protein